MQIAVELGEATVSPIKSARRSLEYIKVSSAGLQALLDLPLTEAEVGLICVILGARRGPAKDLSTRMSMSLVILHSWRASEGAEENQESQEQGVPSCEVM